MQHLDGQFSEAEAGYWSFSNCSTDPTEPTDRKSVV